MEIGLVGWRLEEAVFYGVEDVELACDEILDAPRIGSILSQEGRDLFYFRM